MSMMIMSPSIQSTGSTAPQALDLSTQSSFSTKPFSLSLGHKKSTKAAKERKTFIPRKRPHTALADDSDHEEANQHEQPQFVTTFGQGHGDAADPDGKNPPLVIQSQRNRDWRAESYKRRGKNLLPAEERAAREGKLAVLDDAADDEKPQYGLVISAAKTESGDVEMREAGTTTSEAELIQAKPQSADDEALAALLGQNTTTSTLVLPAVSGTGADDPFVGRISGEDAFRSAVASCPDSASLDAYAAVPIEEFGAALLRGMGWRDGEAVGRRKGAVVTPRIVVRRPALLGIGAKEIPEGLEELGAWGKGAKKKAEKYHPVLLKNSKTGEMVTEEELKAKLEKKDDNITGDDWRARRDRNLRIDEGRKINGGHSKPLSTRDRSRSRERKRSKRDDLERRRDSDGNSDRWREQDQAQNQGQNRGQNRGQDREQDRERGRKDSKARESSDGHGSSRSSKHGEKRHDEKRYDEKRDTDRNEDRNDSKSSAHRRRDDRRHGYDDTPSRRH